MCAMLQHFDSSIFFPIDHRSEKSDLNIILGVNTFRPSDFSYDGEVLVQS